MDHTKLYSNIIVFFRMFSPICVFHLHLRYQVNNNPRNISNIVVLHNIRFLAHVMIYNRLLWNVLRVSLLIFLTLHKN